MMNNIKRMSKIALISALIVSMACPVYAEESVVGTREETVYGLLNANGSANQIIVTEHIQKDKDIKSLEVTSNLEDVSLLMDSVDFKEQNGSLSFTTDESDIYYRGISSETLPVTTEITYELDGKEVQSKDLAGQSGHLKMTIKQTNNEKRTIEFNGESADVYLPFESAIVVNMDNQKFENVTSDYGVIVDDGALKILTAVLTPGLEASFEEFDSKYITDQVVLEADVTAVELSEIYMTTVCKLPNIDVDQVLDELSDVDSKVDEFSDAGTELVDGTSTLKTGVNTYFGKQEEAFVQFDSYLENDQKLLQSIIGFNNKFADFDTALKLYTTGVAELLSGITAMSDSSPALAAGMTSLKAGITQVLPKNAQTAVIFGTLDQLETGTIQLDAGLQQVKAGAAVLSEKTTLLTTASAQLKAGSEQLSGAAGQLADANKQLDAGVQALGDASVQVVEGVESLDSGMKQFKREGIDTLVAEIEKSLDNIELFEAKYEALLEEVEKYNSFTGKVTNLDNTLIFIMKANGIEIDK